MPVGLLPWLALIVSAEVYLMKHSDMVDPRTYTGYIRFFIVYWGFIGIVERKWKLLQGLYRGILFFGCPQLSWPLR